jgi:hypothetical protein
MFRRSWISGEGREFYKYIDDDLGGMQYGRYRSLCNAD